MKKIRITNIGVFITIAAVHVGWLMSSTPAVRAVTPQTALSFVDLSTMSVPSASIQQTNQASMVQRPSNKVKSTQPKASNKPSKSQQAPAKAANKPKSVTTANDIALLKPDNKSQQQAVSQSATNPAYSIDSASEADDKTAKMAGIDSKNVGKENSRTTAASIKPASHIGGHLNNLPPPYPQLALEAGEQGSVGIRAVVEPNGRPSNVRLARSSGHRRLDMAALAAAKKYRFTPATQNGQPIRFVYTFNLNFRLP